MRSIPDDNLAYPILMNIDNQSTGSGFFINCTKYQYLVTAKHVLFNEENELNGKELTITCPSKDLKEDKTTEFKIQLEEMDIKFHKQADVAVVKMGEISHSSIDNNFKVNYLHGVNLKRKSAAGTVGASPENILFLKDVLIPNDVYMYGYPTSLGLKNSPQFDYNKPLLRKGIVANTYTNIGTIILDCPAYYGNSGGPVVQVSFEGSDKGLLYYFKIIGVVSQLIPFVEKTIIYNNGTKNVEFSNSGYSVAVCMDKVFELIDD